MKAIFIKLALIFVSFNAMQLNLNAASYKNNLEILSLQSNGPDVTYPGMIWVEIDDNTAAWSGDTCSSRYVIVEASAYPHMVAMLLTAFTTGKKVRIYVDDTYKTNTYCHLKSLYFTK